VPIRTNKTFNKRSSANGDNLLDYRDRAILKFFLYSAGLSTACRLKVSDFHQDGDEATIRLHEKGDKRRTIGLHFQAAQAIAEYIEHAGLASGPLFGPRLNPRSKKLAIRFMDPASLYRVVESYLNLLKKSFLHCVRGFRQGLVYSFVLPAIISDCRRHKQK
jgi:integrase